MAGAVIAAALAGCNKNDDGSQTPPPGEYRISVSAPTTQKVANDGIEVKWEKNDIVRAYEIGADYSWIPAGEFVIDWASVSPDGKQAEFVGPKALAEGKRYMISTRPNVDMADPAPAFRIVQNADHLWLMSDMVTVGAEQSSFSMHHESAVLELTIEKDAATVPEDVAIQNVIIVYPEMTGTVSGAGAATAPGIRMEGSLSAGPQREFVATTVVPQLSYQPNPRVVLTGDASTCVVNMKILPNPYSAGVPMKIVVQTVSASGGPLENWEFDKTGVEFEAGALYPVRLQLVRAEQLVAEPDDRAALMAIYDAMGGSEWPDHQNWGSDQPLSAWAGVSVNAAGRVVALNLRGVTGQFPVGDPIVAKAAPRYGINSLTELEHLEVQGWNEQGEAAGRLPAEIGELQKLESVVLNGLSVGGAVPESWGGLANLTTLVITGTQITSLPASIGGLGNLHTLNVANNRLTAIPAEVAGMENLGTFVFQFNKIESVPEALKANPNYDNWPMLNNSHQVDDTGNDYTIPGILDGQVGAKLDDLVEKVW